jgi:hypothetical protein
MPIVNPITFYGSTETGGGPSAPTPTVYWEADFGIVTTTDGTTADSSPVSGNKVLSWTSKDASATVASYGTNANRPTYIVPTYGNPYVTFDGSLNQRLETTAWNSTFNGAAAYTMGVYFRRPPVYSGYRNESFMSLNNTGNAGTLQAGPSGAGVSIFSGGVTYINSGARVVLSYATELVGTTSFFGSFFTASTGSTAASSITKLYFDGVLVASDTTSNATVNYTNVITLGGTFDTSTSKTKDCYGFYLFNTQLSDANVLAVHNAAATRMNVSGEFAKTVLLLHFDGADGSTTCTDNSVYNFNVTANGTAALSTSSKQFGTASLNLDGGPNTWLSIGASGALNLGTRNFTMEFWFKIPAGASGSPYGKTFVSNENNVWSAGAFSFYGIASSTVFRPSFWVNEFSSSAPLLIPSSGDYRDNAWHHIAIVRNGSAFTMFIDGNQVATGTHAGNCGSGSRNIMIGDNLANNVGDRNLTGMIDEFSLTLLAKYTGAFTPSGPFPNS